MRPLCAGALLAVLGGCTIDGPPPDPHREAWDDAKASPSHPLGGQWKQKCDADWGLAIGPLSETTYYVSFCGPINCFAKGTYRPETTIIGDNDYRLVDDNTMEVVGRLGITDTWRRCG
jgi:hypothetical protein